MSKPIAKVVGQNGNVFVTLSICTSVLNKVGQHKEAKEMSDKVFSCCSYDEALSIMMEYCDLE